jgi:hypothetical protein
MGASQNKSDVTNRFGDRDIILAVCVHVSSANAAVSKFFAIFVRKIKAEIHFRSMEASDIESDVTIQFLFGVLDIHLAGIFHVSCSVQKLFKNFLLLQHLKIFSILGADMTPKDFCKSRHPKTHFLRKSALIEALWSRWLLPFGL